jgi:predicted amidophosphoribosyltransferase
MLGDCHSATIAWQFDREFPEGNFLRQRLSAPPVRFSFGAQLWRALARARVLLKHEAIESMGSWFAEGMALVVKTEGERMAAEAIVAVLLHQLRRRERGFNQVDLVGNPLSGKLRLRCQPVLLMRSRTSPEKLLLGRKSAGKRYVALLR